MYFLHLPVEVFVIQKERWLDMKILNDSMAVCLRELKPMMRDPFSLLFTLVQPLLLLFLFGPLLAGMIGASGMEIPGSETTWQWFVPGMLVMLCLFGTGAAGFNLLTEVQSGSWERILVTPLSRSALLIGRAVKEMVPLFVQAGIIVVLAATLVGFAVYPLGALIGFFLLAVFGIGIASLSYTLAILVRNQDWIFWAVQQTLLFPLLILSDMLLPLDIAPVWMQHFARINPVTNLVNAQRVLFAGDLSSPLVIPGIIAALATAMIGMAVGIPVIRRHEKA
jgi:ABC-2 type transport system permease protein